VLSGAPREMTGRQIRLACPACRAPLRSDEELSCPACGASYPIVNGIPVLLPQTGQEDTLGVAELYHDVASDYDHVFSHHVVEHYLTRRSRLVRGLAAQGLLLDVGCGTGILAERLQRTGYEVAGLDLAPAMLEEATRRGLRHVYAAQSTAMPFEDHTFDLAITVATLHHLETPERVKGTIREMARVVRPGGWVVLWDHNPLNPYWPLIMSRVPQDSGDERLVPLQEVLDDVQAAGLNLVSATQVGLVPDFMPLWLMPTWRKVEAAFEATPGLRRLAAHNVVIARNP